MVFNGEAGNYDLCTLADKLVKTDDTDFPLLDKAMYANWGFREIVKAILMVYGGWIFDDSNGSGEPTALTNLLDDGTQFYALATMQWLYGVEWSDANGNWTRLLPITLEEIKDMGYAETEFMNVEGKPMYYRPVKNGIKIYPPSDTAVTSGLKALIGRDITSFTAASTSTSPGYDSLAGHEALAVFMAMKHAQINTLDSYAGLFSDWITGLSSIKTYYAQKFSREHPPKIRKTGGIADQYVS